jgi:outer membrane protein
MKRTNGFRIALFAFATMLFFTQCAKEQSAQQSNTDATNTAAVAEKSIKIAFVDIDSLLAKYEFSIIVNKEMLRKEEDMRMKLAEKAKALQADYDDFQKKLQNNVYATRERAEEEQARILKQKDALEKLEQRLIGELSAESQKNNITLHEKCRFILYFLNWCHCFVGAKQRKASRR